MRKNTFTTSGVAACAKGDFCMYPLTIFYKTCNYCMNFFENRRQIDIQIDGQIDSNTNKESAHEL